MKNSFKIVSQMSSYTRIKSVIFADFGEECFEAIRRIFVQKGVTSVEINRASSTASIYFSDSFNVDSFLKSRVAVAKLPIISRVFLNDSTLNKICFNRIDNSITNWEIVHEMSHRIRFQHLRLKRSEFTCQQVEKVFYSTPGVEKCDVSNLTGSVLIKYKEGAVDKDMVIHLLEEILEAIPADKIVKDQKEFSRFDMATASFALALALPEVAILTVPAVLYTGYPIFKNAFNAFKERKVKVDILDSVVIAGCLAAGQTSVAAFMVWVVSLADKIQDSTSKSTEKMLGEIFNTQPKFAWLKKGDKEVQVSVHGLKKNDEIVVHTGETVPVDGVIAEGGALIDQSALTGESQPVERVKGENVLACTTVISGQINITVQITGGETIAGKIQKIITEVSQHKSKAQSKGEEIANKAVIPTLALGGLGMAIGGPGIALAVVNCDYGTGIRVAAPTLLLTHLIKLAKQGILVKNGAALDKLLKVDVFLFDKTGTLTHEVPEIVGIVSLTKNYSEDKILEYAATAEQRMSHPIARAIIDEAKKKKIVFSGEKKGEKCKIGLGVEVTIGQDNVKVGSMKYMTKEGITASDEVSKTLENVKKEGQGAIVVSINDEIAGIIKLKTVAREDSMEIVKFLKKSGVKEVVLLSGDHKEVVAATARELGADDYIAEVMPHEKADWVKKYKAEGKVVAMVGDGVNDGPALALADVAISLRGASDIATDTAHIIFLDGNFSKIHLLFENAHGFNKGVWSSFKLIAVPNTICIAGALAGFWGLGMSLVFNNLFNVIATVKSLMPLYATADQNTHKALPTPTPALVPVRIDAPVYKA